MHGLLRHTGGGGCRRIADSPEPDHARSTTSLPLAMTQPISGVLSPVVTPFKPDLSPDPERFVRQCKWLLANGVGLAVFGTNSEANSLAVAERMELLCNTKSMRNGVHPDDTIHPWSPREHEAAHSAGAQGRRLAHWPMRVIRFGCRLAGHARAVVYPASFWPRMASTNTVSSSATYRYSAT